MTSSPTMAPEAVDMDLSGPSGPSGDVYQGTPSALIAAGLMDETQVPGGPGMPKVCASFVNGVLQPKSARPKHDERWMRVIVYGSKLRVVRGIGREEQERRRQNILAMKAEAAKAAGIPAISLEEAARQANIESALLTIGDLVTIRKKAAVVTGEHRLRCVASEDGEYVLPNGQRVEYRPGYLCRHLDGEEFFWAAHELEAEGRATHLRVVRRRIADALNEAEPAKCWPFPIVGGTFMGRQHDGERTWRNIFGQG